MLHIVGEEGHHVFAELLRNHDGRIVFTGFRAFDGVGLGGDGPVEFAVGAQGVDHLVAHGDFNRNQIGSIALIHIGYGELQVLHVRERIPASGHIEPGEQAGNHDQANHDDDGHHIAGQALDVAGKELPDCAHRACLPSLVGGVEGMVRVSALWSGRASTLAGGR